MKYQGEDWVFTVKGDSNIDLDSADDFKVYFYLYDNPSTTTSVTKTQCTKIGDNLYKGKVPYATTKTLPTGIYSIEVLLITGTTNRTVYVKQRAFENSISASKTVQ